ncbi:MAG: hypothetical protein ABIQ40_11090 [Bacteroidia bacterium]
MTRNVICTVKNNSGYDLTLLGYAPGKNSDSSGGAFSNEHGTFHKGPESTLKNGKETLAFKIQKTSGGSVGTTGWVRYDLKNGQGQLVLMFNNPHDRSGKSSNKNCWFYALIQGIEKERIGIPLMVRASVSGFNFNLADPTEQDEMNVTVTLESI